MALSYDVAKNDTFLRERVRSTDLSVKYNFAC